MILLAAPANDLVAASILLSWQKTCLVATKMILVAAPASDTNPAPKQLAPQFVSAWPREACQSAHVLVATKLVKWRAYFCRFKRRVLSREYHWRELSQVSFLPQKYFVVTNLVCRDKSFVATKRFCDKHNFVATSILLPRQKTCFVTTNTNSVQTKHKQYKSSTNTQYKSSTNTVQVEHKRTVRQARTQYKSSTNSTSPAQTVQVQHKPKYRPSTNTHTVHVKHKPSTNQCA